MKSHNDYTQLELLDKLESLQRQIDALDKLMHHEFDDTRRDIERTHTRLDDHQDQIHELRNDA